MKVEYGDEVDSKLRVPNMVVTFENDEEWYSLVYDDSWIAKAVKAHTLPRRGLWGDHVRCVMPITLKDLDADELIVFEKIKTILQEVIAK